MEATQNYLLGLDYFEIEGSPKPPPALPIWIRKSDMAMAESVFLHV
jgi:hypothetical protein